MLPDLYIKHGFNLRIAKYIYFSTTKLMKEKKLTPKYISLQQLTCTETLKISLSLQIMRKLNAGYWNDTLQDGYSETVNIKLDSETPKFLCRANANVRASLVFLVDVCAAAAAHGTLPTRTPEFGACSSTESRLLTKGLSETRSSMTIKSPQTQRHSCPFPTHEACRPRAPTWGHHIRRLGGIAAIALSFLALRSLQSWVIVPLKNFSKEFPHPSCRLGH